MPNLKSSSSRPVSTDPETITDGLFLMTIYGDEDMRIDMPILKEISDPSSGFTFKYLKSSNANREGLRCTTCASSGNSSSSNHELESPGEDTFLNKEDNSIVQSAQPPSTLAHLPIESDLHVNAIVSEPKTMPEPNSLNTYSSPSTPQPHSSDEKSILRIKRKLNRLRLQRIKGYSQPVYVAPIAKPNVRALDDTLFPLLEKAKSFLASNRQVMLILAESGAGKSTFNRYLEYELWNEYGDESPIPLFINLPELDQPECSLISKQLKIYGFTKSQIQYLKQHRQLVVICDGYDECQLTQNLHTANRFNRPKQPNVKLITACRSQYLEAEYRKQFVPTIIGQPKRAAYDLFQECYITLFSETQIENYVEQYVFNKQKKKDALEAQAMEWDKKDYIHMIKTIPNLKDLVRNPFLLKICLDILPRLVLNNTDMSRFRVTRSLLYDNFVQYWMEINKLRLIQIDAASENFDRVAFDNLLADGFILNGIKYQMNLAKAMFQYQDGRVIINYSQHQDKDTWKGEFFGPNSENAILRDSSLLIRTDSQFQFTHRSILEYFYSCSIWGPINEGNTFDREPTLELDNTSLSISDHPLSRRLIVKETSIIQFLADRVIQNEVFKQQLIEMVKLSKTDKAATSAAANSMTILVKAGVPFHGEDLQNIRIPDANLSEGLFDSVQFQGADLTNVNLAKSWIRQADFTNAVMENVQFGELPYLESNDRPLTCVYSPKGVLFAVGHNSGKITIYNTANWKLIQTYKVHSNGVPSLAFSPCSNFLLSGSWDNTVRLWNRMTKESVFVLNGHTHSVYMVAFSPLGGQGASGSNAGTVRVWDLKKGTLISLFESDSKFTGRIAYSPDGKNIACTCKNATIQVLNIHSEETTLVVRCESNVNCLTYSPDGRWIISGHQNGEVWMWDSDTGNPGQHWKGHDQYITTFAYLPRRQWIAVGSTDKTIKLWNVQSGTLVSSFTGRSDFVMSVAFSPGCLQLASCGLEKVVRLWDLKTTEIGFVEENPSERIESVKYSIDGEFIISSDISGDVRIHNVLTGEIVRTIRCGRFSVKGLTISPDGQRIAIISKVASVQIWSIQSGLIELVLEDFLSKVRTVAFSPCGQWIATGGEERSIQLRDARSGEMRQLLSRKKDESVDEKFFPDHIAYMQFSADSQRVYTASSGGSIWIWNIAGEKFSTEKIVELPTNYVCFSSDELLISNVHDVKIWNLSKGKFQHNLKHRFNVFCSEWSHCKQWIATSCKDEVWLWRKTSYRSRTEWKFVDAIRDFQGLVESIAWKPNALEFVTGCRDGSVRVWKLEEALGVWSVKLVWGVAPSVLAVSGVKISDAIDLSPVNHQLLQQRAHRAIRR